MPIPNVWVFLIFGMSQVLAWVVHRFYRQGWRIGVWRKINKSIHYKMKYYRQGRESL
jgi:hypothetical protein